MLCKNVSLQKFLCDRLWIFQTWYTRPFKILLFGWNGVWDWPIPGGGTHQKLNLVSWIFTDQIFLQVDEELICPICSAVLEVFINAFLHDCDFYIHLWSSQSTQHLQDPRLAPECEHAFCAACIHEWLNRQQTCPVDRCSSFVNYSSFILWTYICKIPGPSQTNWYF